MLRVACLGDSLTKGNESLYDGGPKPRALRLLGNYPRALASLLPPTLPAPSSRRGSGRSLQVVVRNFGRGGATANFDGRNVYTTRPSAACRPALWSGDARSSCCPRCAAPRAS